MKHRAQGHFLLCDMKNNMERPQILAVKDYSVVSDKFARQIYYNNGLSISKKPDRVVVWLFWWYVPRMPSASLVLGQPPTHLALNGTRVHIN